MTQPRKYEQAYAKATDLLVEALEAGQADPSLWSKPWQALARLDSNPATKAIYRGGNAVACAMTRYSEGWDQPSWSTYRGWQGLGRQVRKGEKSLWLVHWTILPSRKDPDRTVFIPNAFNVFNFAQTEPVEDHESPWVPAALVGLDGGERHAEADDVIAASGARISYVAGSPSAFYSSATDSVTLPAYEDFRSGGDFYATTFHEITHWTGPRLNRDLTGRFGSDSYAAEELVAELGSVFALARLGLSPEGPRPDHAHYLSSWIRSLKADPKTLYHVAGKAQKAIELVFHDPKAKAQNPGSPDAGDDEAVAA